MALAAPSRPWLLHCAKSSFPHSACMRIASTRAASSGPLCLPQGASPFAGASAGFSVRGALSQASLPLQSQARASLPVLPLRRRIQWRCMATVDAPAEAQAPAVSPEEAEKLVPGLDLRVGRILKAWKHPEADSLYVEEVDVGEAEGPRTICSGLVKYIPEEEMQDRLVVVLANLKPRNMRGVKSNGMLLAASDASHENVELLLVPEGAAPGERVWFGTEADGASLQPAATPNQLQKKKVWEAVQPLLRTTEELVASFQDKPMRVNAGVIRSAKLAGANIS